MVAGKHWRRSVVCHHGEDQRHRTSARPVECRLPNEKDVKYGVISTAALQRDLETWDTLYIAGRLQKPVRLNLLPTPSSYFRSSP